MHKGSIKELITYLRLFKRELLIVFISLFTVAFSILGIGYVLRMIIDTGLAQTRIGNLNSNIILMSILIIIFAISSFYRSYYINSIADKVTAYIKRDVYHQVLKFDIAAFEEIKVGDIITRLSSDVEQISKLIINFLSYLIRNIIMSIGAIILMFTSSTKLSLLVVIVIPILLIPIIKLSQHVRHFARIVLEEQGNLSANIEEMLSGIHTVHAYNQQQAVYKDFLQKIEHYLKHSATRLKYRSLFFSLAILVIAGTITAIIWVGALDIMNNRMSSGEMVSFIYYAIISGMSAGSIAELFSEIHTPKAALDRVFQLKEMKIVSSLTHNNSQTSRNVELNFYKSITFKNVSFTYPARADIKVLDDISFSIKQGKFTAIIGKSGSGKSTLMQILLKLYEYQGGNIYIDNINIRDIHTTKLRKMIAYVQQDPMVFSGSIRSNITFANPSATEQEISEVVKICGIDDFLDQLEEGINTFIGQRGVRLSGGQKQRIAIARSLLYKPEILLLDEATSAIDYQGEAKLLYALRRYMQDKTIISIAHRVSSIENADEIIVIENGQLEASGQHKDLLKSSRCYQNLVKL